MNRITEVPLLEAVIRRKYLHIGFKVVPLWGRIAELLGER